MKKVSLKDIASKIGVAPSTVSFVLNGKAKEMRISDALTKKIRSEAKRLGYMPNQIAVSLRTGQSRIIGLIVEDISNNFFASLARSIEKELEVYNYRVVFCSTENSELKGRELIRMLSQQQVDGYLITPTPGMEDDIRQLIEAQVPVVLIDRYFPAVGAPYVMSDNFRAVTEGMKHLLQKGYKNIAFITVELDLIQMKERETAFREAMYKEQGISAPQIVKLPFQISAQDSVLAITDFLKAHPETDAVFFATNYLGIAGLECIKNLNLKIPDQIAVMCFDDHDIFRLHTPAITCLRQPIHEIACNATGLLMQQLSNLGSTIPEPPVTTLVIRQST
jgi:LacI family transcriptional regulator